MTSSTMVSSLYVKTWILSNTMGLKIYEKVVSYHHNWDINISTNMKFNLPLIPALKKQRQSESLTVWGQPSLQSEFLDSPWMLHKETKSQQNETTIPPKKTPKNQKRKEKGRQQGGKYKLNSHLISLYHEHITYVVSSVTESQLFF